MTAYVQIGVSNVTGERVITVKDDLASKERVVTDPREKIEALLEARFEYALTPEEKKIVAGMEEDKRSMEANVQWGAF